MDIIDKLLADELPGDRQSTREARILLTKLREEAAYEIKRLIEGPGGIMEMKQTIADKEAEIERLRKELLNITGEKQ